MNFADILIILAIAAALAFAVAYIVKTHRSGKCVGCGGNCGSCPGCGEKRK